MGNKIDFIFDCWGKIATFPLKVLKRINTTGKVTEKLLISISKEAERKSPVFVSHMLRRKYSNLFTPLPMIENKENIAIIMQGPIISEEDFTLNTILFYKKYNPTCLIIVSTWTTENNDVIAKIKSTGAIVIQETPPANGGYGNINYQLISTKNGIQKALEYEVGYICKTRTDQRIEDPYAFIGMRHLIENYPSYNTGFFSSRLVVLATEYGSMFEPYYVSDFMFFGTASDMKKFLYIELDNRLLFERKKLTRKQLVETKGIAEIYIMKSIAEQDKQNKYDVSVKGYWDFVKDNLVLIDKPMIKLYWPKYDSRYCEHLRNGTYTTETQDERSRLSNFNFNSWLALINGELVYNHSFEKYLDQCL